MAGPVPVIAIDRATVYESAADGDPVAGGRLYWKLETPMPPELVIGRGLAWDWRGYCFHSALKLRRMVLHIGARSLPLAGVREPREDVARRFLQTDRQGHSLMCGFRETVPLDGRLAGSGAAVSMELEFDRGLQHVLEFGMVRFVAHPVTQAWQDDSIRPGPGTVAVCMATYNPDPDGFRRQVDSLLAQDYTDWIGIINDDGSGEQGIVTIERECARDPRLKVFRNDSNLGFYRNFESALWRVPPQCGYVALADQDDAWYPDKLSSLVDSLSGGALLTYSDMRIVDDTGRVIADSYWTRRRNNYRDLRVILLANTVTGAASLFRRELLDRVLPFPQRIGDAFHDNWIACSALAGGELAYVERPLYDYVQHSASVIGHCDFGARSAGDRLRGLIDSGKLLFKPSQAKARLLKLRNSGLAIYDQEYRRLKLFQRTIGLRQPVADRRKRAALALFNDSLWSFFRLVFLNPLLALRRDTTDDAELRLAGGWLADRVNRVLLGIFTNAARHKMGRDNSDTA